MTTDTSGQDRVRIVVVDDDEIVRKNLVEYLAHAPEFEIVGMGATGFEAIRLAADLKPDILMSDIRMPVMDGIELAHKASAAHPALKILLMTGYADQRERADDLSKKIVDVVSKPFSLPDIRRAVALALAA